MSSMFEVCIQRYIKTALFFVLVGFRSNLWYTVCGTILSCIRFEKFMTCIANATYCTSVLNKKNCAMNSHTISWLCTKCLDEQKVITSVILRDAHFCYVNKSLSTRRHCFTKHRVSQGRVRPVGSFKK